MLITSVRDQVADRYLGFQLVDSEAVAVRGFKAALAEALDKREGLYFYYPGDFDLYVLGEYDDEHASFNIFDAPRCLYRGSSFVVLSNKESDEDGE